MSMLKKVRFFSKAPPELSKEEEAERSGASIRPAAKGLPRDLDCRLAVVEGRSSKKGSKINPEGNKRSKITEHRTPAGGGEDYSRRTSRTSRSELGSVRAQCDIFSITNDPASEFEEAPAPVPPSVRLTWRLIALLTLAHAILLLVNVVLLFTVDGHERKSHQQVLLFSLLMLTNLVLVIVMMLVVVRQNKAITQCGICCTFWTAFAYFVILAYNSLDDPLSLVAGRTCLTVIIVTILELATLTVYFVLRFIRYKKVVELYNCRACTCDKDCQGAREPTRCGFNDLWPRAEAPAPLPRPASSVTPVSSVARESPIDNLPPAHY